MSVVLCNVLGGGRMLLHVHTDTADVPVRGSVERLEMVFSLITPNYADNVNTRRRTYCYHYHHRYHDN